MSESKRKGTLAETAVVSFLRTAGFPYAERLALQGNKDRGDVTGIPGVVVEVKNEQTYQFSSWLQEAGVERESANAIYGIVVAKPRMVGTTRTDQWMAIMRLHEYVHLLAEAGLFPSSVWVQDMSGASISTYIAKSMKLAADHALQAGKDWWIVRIPPRGVKDQDMYYAVTCLSQVSGLLVRAGYGRGPDDDV